MPDDFGNAMMKEWLKQNKISIDDINPVDRLTYKGKRGMGALESVFRVGGNLELKLKFEKAKLKAERKRASRKIK